MWGLQRVDIRISNQCNTQQYAVECLCMSSLCLLFTNLLCFIYFILFLLKGVILPYVRHSGEPHPLSRPNDLVLAYGTILEAAGTFLENLFNLMRFN